MPKLSVLLSFNQVRAYMAETIGTLTKSHLIFCATATFDAPCKAHLYQNFAFLFDKSHPCS